MRYWSNGSKDDKEAMKIRDAFGVLGYNTSCVWGNFSDDFLYHTLENDDRIYVAAKGTIEYDLIRRLAELDGEYVKVDADSIVIEPKFKDGDVLCTYECGNPKIVFILRGKPEGNYSVLSYYCYYNIMYPHFESNAERGCLAPKRENVKPATKEQRDLLFAKMKEAGYEWDEKKKELKNIPKHYDIANFKPFDKVLVRDNDRGKWRPSIFSYHIKGRQTCYPFCCIGNSFSQCIPFEGNETLLGTTDMCNERFINW